MILISSKVEVFGAAGEGEAGFANDMYTDTSSIEAGSG
jgi:hypothetical protein